MTREQLVVVGKEKIAELQESAKGRFDYLKEIQDKVTVLEAFCVGRGAGQGWYEDIEIVCHTDDSKDYKNFIKAQSVDTLLDDFDAYVKEVIKETGRGVVFVRVMPEVSFSVKYGHIVYGMYTRLIA